MYFRLYVHFWALGASVFVVLKWYRFIVSRFLPDISTSTFVDVWSNACTFWATCVADTLIQSGSGKMNGRQIVLRAILPYGKNWPITSVHSLSYFSVHYVLSRLALYTLSIWQSWFLSGLKFICIEMLISIVIKLSHQSDVFCDSLT